MKTLFGGGSQQKSEQFSGFGALPKGIQERFRRLAYSTDPLRTNPEQYYSPASIGDLESEALGLIQGYSNPRTIEQFMSPYRDIITQDINRSFENPYSALKSRASEAGAFGSSRYRRGEADLERERLDAIARASSGQYNQALAQQQQAIKNLLGFGGLERNIDLAQRQAPLMGLRDISSILSPLLSSSSNISTRTDGGRGLLGGLTDLAGSVGGLLSGGAQAGLWGSGGFFGGGNDVIDGARKTLPVSQVFSDPRLKRDVKKIGKKNGFNLYQFKYLWSDDIHEGFMADEVEKVRPDVIGEFAGYKTVDYGALNG